MPAIYAHETFGLNALNLLDNETKEIISNNFTQYKLGLQGPDLFFYYRPYLRCSINKLAFILHNNPVNDFLQKASTLIKNKGIESKEFAYILGFICHFTLDSTCHPYITKEVDELKFNHIEMEGEFDKFLLKKDNIEPLSFPAHNMVPYDSLSIDTINNVYNSYTSIPKSALNKTLRSFKFYKKILVAPNDLKRNTMNFLMKMTGQYDLIQGHLFKPHENPKSYETNPKLLSLYENATPLASELMKNYTSFIKKETYLSDKFNRNLK